MRARWMRETSARHVSRVSGILPRVVDAQTRGHVADCSTTVTECARPRPSPTRARAAPNPPIARTLTATFTPVLSCTPSFTHPNAPLPSVCLSAYEPTRVTSRVIPRRAMSTPTRAAPTPSSSGTGWRRDRRCRRRRCAARARGDDDADDEARRARVARATAALPIGEVVETCLRALEVRDASNDATRDLVGVFFFALAVDAIDERTTDEPTDARRRVEARRCRRRRARARRRRFRWR